MFNMKDMKKKKFKPQSVGGLLKKNNKFFYLKPHTETIMKKVEGVWCFCFFRKELI